MENKKSFYLAFLLEIYSHILNTEKGQTYEKFPNNIIIFTLLLLEKNVDKRQFHTRSILLG